MYTLTFNNALNELTVQNFDDSTDAVNAAVHLQVMDGGYNTSTEWWYEVTDSDGKTVYADECMKWSQKTRQLAKVYPKPMKGYENGEAPEFYRSV